MKKLSLGITVAAALGFVTGPVSAADMPVKAPPPVMLALYNWSGFYIGPEGGAIMGQNSDWIIQPGGLSVTTCDPATCANVGHPMHGGFVGGEAGFNFQAPGSRWVFGIEGDGQWAEIEEALTCAFGAIFSCGSRISDFESVRGRIGYAFGPRGDFLVFVTGGWVTARQSAFLKTLATPFGTVEVWHRNNGFQVGGGAEYGITPWLSLKGEVIYTWLPSHTYCENAAVEAVRPCLNSDIPTFNFAAKIHDDFILARMGLNARFWWGKAPTPVVARY